jgi:hypothetical protein
MSGQVWLFFSSSSSHYSSIAQSSAESLPEGAHVARLLELF